MTKIIGLLLLTATMGYSQIIEPVKWTTEVKKISNTEYELIINATIDANYHLYSQKALNNGPLPTVFIFEKSDDYELIGTTSEEKGHIVYDPVFKSKIKYFNTKTTFRQKIKLNNKNHFKITGEIEFMACDDSTCVPGYEDMEFKI